MLAGYLVLLCLFSLSTAVSVHAEVKIITSEASYIMGDGESPSFAESMALQKAKRIALEEAGTYVESYTKTRNQDLTKDEIQTLAGGVLQVEIIEKTRTLVQDGLRVYLKIRATVTTDKMEELARRIRGKDLAGEYRDLQTKYDSFAQEVTRLKQMLAKSPSSLERETALNRIREQEGSLANLQKNETALFKRLISGEALVAEARKVLHLSDIIINAILQSGVDLRIADFNPTLVRGRPGFIELNIDVPYQINDNLLGVIQQAATERQAVIDDILLYRDDITLGSTNVQEPLLRAKLIKFSDTKENRDELHFLKEALSHLDLLVELFSDKKLLGFCRFPYLQTQLVPGPELEERSFPVNTSLLERSDLTTNLTSTSKYFGSETEYKDFMQLDERVRNHWVGALKKREKVPKVRSSLTEDIANELDEELKKIKKLEVPQKEKNKLGPEPKPSQMENLSKEIQEASKKRDVLFEKAIGRWLDDHPSFIRIARQRSSNSNLHSASLIIVNQEYVLTSKLVISEQSLRQLTHTTARLVKSSEDPAKSVLPWSRSSDACEASVYRSGK